MNWRRRVLQFCIPVFVLSWSLQTWIALAYGNPKDPRAVPWGIAVMFTPALITLVLAALNRESRALIQWRPSWRMLRPLFVGAVIPIVLAFATVAIVEILSWGKSAWFEFSTTTVVISAGPWFLGLGSQGWPLFIANVLVTGAGFAVLNALAAVGEELGWRGFLQGILIKELGMARGIALLGLIWSFWHLPLLLAGYNYPEHPVLGAFVLFPLQLIAASYFFGWLTIRAGSFWPAAIAHGAVNSIQEGVSEQINMSVPHIYEDMTRLALVIVTGLLFWWLLQRERKSQHALALGAVHD
ncbi:MAG TPA: type II CAAX endopeptidase family protein [Steroidobacteraceae bacterium]|nr:type II CAAX endopeptidase family protein [Steroidobacteraceae bacterium]